MKLFKKYVMLLIASLGVITACKDDSIVIVPEWESAVHGFASVTSSNKDFLYNNPTVDIDIDLKWISIDNKLTVQKIEIYALFDEAYIDSEGNPKLASHGGKDGKLVTTFEGSAVPANRGAISLSITQNAVYELYKTAKFDYDNGNGEVGVFTNPAKPQRTGTKRFMWDDAITIRWEYTTDDGRVFKTWGPSVCTEFPGANCQIDIGVVCATTITDPGANGGLYVINMTDTYGDGWNDAAIRVKVDGVAKDYTLASGSAGVTNVQVPPTAVTLTFEFVSGDWDSEVLFTIKSPKGNTIAKGGPSPAAGPIKLDLCLE